MEQRALIGRRRFWGGGTVLPGRAAQARRTAELTVARRAMACEFTVTLPAGCRRGVEAGCAALDEVERLEDLLSIFRSGSILSEVNRRAAQKPVPVPPGVFHLLAEAGRLAAETGGAFDAACGRLIEAWGFLCGPARVPPEGEWARARAASGWQHVHLDPAARTVAFDPSGVQINLGGIGKGYALDRSAALVRREFGIRTALLVAGGSSVLAAGAPEDDCTGWTVAIADPRSSGGRTLLRLRLRDRALGTSGAANRFFVSEGRRYGHVLDARSGRPAGRLLGASVTAPTAAEADALSTAFFVMGLEDTLAFCEAHPEIGAVLVVPGENRTAPRVCIAGAARKELVG